MKETYINNLINNNVNDVFIQLKYNSIVNNNEIIYKKTNTVMKNLKLRK